MKKINKRIIALLLCLTMVCSGSVAVFAEDEQKAGTIAVEETKKSDIPQTSEDTANSESKESSMEETCEECGCEEGHLEDCSKFVKDTDNEIEPPLDTETQTDDKDLLNEFLQLVDNMPAPEEVEEFAKAIDAYAEAHTYITLDLPLLPEDVEAYSKAYDTFAIAMGYESGELEADYPNSILEDELRNNVMQAWSLYYDVEEMYSDQLTPALMTLALDEETEETEEIEETEDIDQNIEAELPGLEYTDALAKLDAIVEAMPTLMDNGVMLLAANDDAQYRVPSVEENIQINLFDYGPLINTQISGQGLMYFIHNENTYGWAVDSTGSDKQYGSGQPQLDRVLGITSPYPYINTASTNILAGKLEYLFSPTFSTGRINESTYFSNLYDPDTNPYKYASIYFPVKNDDGSGTGLFQKEGDYYIYDSAKNAAWYNPDTDKFELYNYILRPAYTVYSQDSNGNASASAGNFLPFNKGHEEGREDYQSETYEKTYDKRDSDGNLVKDAAGKPVKATANVAKTETVSTKPAGAKTTAYRLHGTGRTTEVNLWFGISMEFDFNMPKNGLISDVPMVFDFLGDDDVFVFIDDVLILDIGGTHGAQEGSINFSTGVVKNPESYGYITPKTSTLYDLMVAAKGANNIDASEFVDSNGDGKLDTFTDYSKHNLKFYYLERGGNISYCKLKFNMDPLPEGNVSLQKKVEGVNKDIEDDKTYEFVVKAQDEQDRALTEIEYVIDASTTTQSIPNGGSISLKANQTATFKNLSAGYDVSIKEKTGDGYTLKSWSLNGQAYTEDSYVQVKDKSEGAMNFVCTNTRKTGDLIIQKEFEGQNHKEDQTYTFELKFNDEAYKGSSTITRADGETETFAFTDGKVQLKVGDSALIEEVPIGMEYSITEEKPDNKFVYDLPVYTLNGSGGKSVEFGKAYEDTIVEEKNNIVVTNSHGLGRIVITKNLVDKNGNSIAAKENQTFLFEVIGPNDQSMQIAIFIAEGQTSNSVTITDLTFGEYKVKELEDWSWRYGLKTVSDKEGTLTSSDNYYTTTLTKSGQSIVFNNTYDDNQWLSGDCYTENWWNSSNEISRKNEQQ